jgi:uncharacterized membrane protein YhaH (DUF805 family)
MSLLSWVLVTIFFALLGALQSATPYGSTEAPFILLYIVVYGGNLWSGFALTVKRLHDLDMAGAHAIWITAIEISALALTVSAYIATASGPLTVVVWIAVVAARLWLIFTRGSIGANRYGPSRVMA